MSVFLTAYFNTTLDRKLWNLCPRNSQKTYQLGSIIDEWAAFSQYFENSTTKKITKSVLIVYKITLTVLIKFGSERAPIEFPENVGLTSSL